jgi:aromatic-amino-acid transaminase
MNNHFNFTSVPLAPADPILGVTEKFMADTRSEKVNLGVGVYQNEQGKAAKLTVVKKAESMLLETDLIASYLPIDGVLDFRNNAQQIMFGANHPAVAEGRVSTVQTPGGTGAIRMGAEFIKAFSSNPTVYISDPSWDNHQAIFRATGFNVEQYPYYDSANKGLNFAGMMDCLSKAKKGATIVLHASCHNPTGYDLSDEQWKEVLALADKQQFVLFLDLAYQGFLKSFEEDPWLVRKLAADGATFLAAGSFSKNLGLYSERIGALHVVTDSKDSANKVQSQIKQFVRTMYSNPPARGSKILNTICADAGLKADWIKEVENMCARIKKMRALFIEKTAKTGVDFDFSHVARQNGMFSYSGLSKNHVLWLREHKALYALESGRICVAALNEANIDYVAQSIAESIKAC